LTGAYATVIGIFLKQLKDGKPLTIVGDGGIQRDFTHVSDVVKANILAAKSSRVGKGEVINIGTGKNYSINEVASMVLASEKQSNVLPARDLNSPHIVAAIASTGSKPEIILASAVKDSRVTYIPSRPGETRRTLANNSKAHRLLDWKPTISLEGGLALLK